MDKDRLAIGFVWIFSIWAVIFIAITGYIELEKIGESSFNNYILGVTLLVQTIIAGYM